MPSNTKQYFEKHLHKLSDVNVECLQIFILLHTLKQLLKSQPFLSRSSERVCL